MNGIRRKEYKSWLILGVVIAVLCIYLFPIYWMIVTAFKTKLDAFSLPPKWFFKPNLDSFRDLFIAGGGAALGRVRGVEQTFAISAFPHQLLNSIIAAFVSTGLVVIVGSLSAYVFSRFPIKGKNDWLFIILSSRMLPPIVAVIPLVIMYRVLHLYDTRIGLIILYTAFNLAFVVWVMKSFIDEIPKEYEEAALVDGYSRFQAFFKFVLPEMRTGIAATAIFSLIMAWNEFTFALLLTGERARTAPPAIANSMGASGINWGQIAAGSFLFVLPVIIFTFLLRKHLLRGFTFGVIKG